MSLVITESLARTVLPLSTNAFYGQLVTLNAAFLRVWRLTRHNMLFDHLSFVSLAGYSESLNSYAFFPINQFRLAGIPEPYSLASKVLSTFHMLPEQSFAFCLLRQDLNLLPTFSTECCSTNELRSEPTKMCCSSCSIPC